MKRLDNLRYRVNAWCLGKKLRLRQFVRAFVLTDAERNLLTDMLAAVYAPDETVEMTQRSEPIPEVVVKTPLDIEERDE